MGIKETFYLGAVLTISSNLFASCKKSECFGNAYQLKETWSITPQRDSINIGDTLIFSSSFSNRPYDYNTQSNVDFSGNALVGTPFGVRFVKGYNDLKPAIDSFGFFLIAGRYKDNDISPKHIKDIFWTESNNVYEIKFGIIAKKRGDYSFSVSDAIGRLTEAKECEDGAGIVLSNSNSDNNAELSHPYYGVNYVPGTDSTHIFCIRVK